MIRKGCFALWNNKEYELVSYQRQYYLLSKSKVELQNGFTEKEGDGGIFLRRIAVLELEDAYEVFPYAIYLGYRFTVEGYNERMHTVALVTNDPFVKEKVAVQPYGKFEYIIELPEEEVVIKEERIRILGFENITL